MRRQLTDAMGKPIGKLKLKKERVPESKMKTLGAGTFNLPKYAPQYTLDPDGVYRGYTLRPKFSSGYLVMLRVRGPLGNTYWHVISEEDTLEKAKAVVDEIAGED